MVRLNLIAAIVSVLPKKRSGGDSYDGGFCYNRYLALKNGKVCLPQNYRELSSLNPNRQLKELAKYINNFSEQDCNNVGGYWKELTSGELSSLKVSKAQFNQHYMNYTAQIQKQYQESILALLDVLNKLEGMPLVDNQTLNKLTEKTQEVIDSLYQACHRSYTYAMFAFVRADLSATPQNRDRESRDEAFLKEEELQNS